MIFPSIPDQIRAAREVAKPRVIQIASRGKFLELFERDSMWVMDHEHEGDRACGVVLRIVARQLVLEDGTVVELRDEGEGAEIEG